MVLEKLDNLSEQHMVTNRELAELSSVLTKKLDAALCAKAERPQITCHYCKKPGHFARNCWKKNSDNEKSNGSGNQNPSA